MEEFDPVEYVRGLKQLLASDKKRIGFLFGAGTSLAKKNSESITVPTIISMTKNIEKELSKENKFKNVVSEIKEEIGEENFNIESFLSNIESKRNVIGKGNLNGLDKDGFDKLIENVKKQIINIISVHKKIIENDSIKNLIHVDFAEWIGRADRKYPIEIFTTNYDYLFELGLENKSIPYYDGFTGSFNPFFNSNSIENMKFLPNQTKLWKIHGSLGWKLIDKKVLRKDSTQEDILIYPSVLKYDNSRKLPYISLMDRLSNFLKQSDTILIILGYSFGDEHINERIITALNSKTTAHVFVLFYDKIDKDNYSLKESSVIAKLAMENSKLTVLGFKNAVIGSIYGEWKINENYEIEDIKDFFELKESDDGELILSDFSKFVNFLLSMTLETGGV
ncbi:SIR2 family protein [Oceanotoga teriensis]|uniref:SIR2 family protein n=1 Tax=Oceanotoga teriensis TaxID=515440 RepID=UPI0027137BD0|nr:SIR2 family protein [Oceanotoga teriensis]MDO7977730.1 SIR2 family protein [Oceanotoga teriensis]